MLTTVGLAAIVLLLLWIGTTLRNLLHETALLRQSLRDLPGILHEASADITSEARSSLGGLADPLERIGVLLAYAVSQREPPLSGLAGEANITFEIDMPEAELELLQKARRAWRHFARRY